MKKHWVFVLVVLCISLVSAKKNGNHTESSKKSKLIEESTTPSNNNTTSKVFSHDTVKKLLEQYKKYDRIRMRSSGDKIDSKKLIEEIRKRRNKPLVDKKIVLPTMKLNYTIGDSASWTPKNYSGYRFSDSVLEKPLLTDDNLTNSDTNSSHLTSGRNSIRPLQLHEKSTTHGSTTEEDTETSSSQTKTKLNLPTQESSDEDRTVIGVDKDKTNSSQGDSHINNLVSTSTDSKVLNIDSLDSDVRNYSLNKTTNQSGLENALSDMNTTLNETLIETLSNLSFDDNETRVTNKTAILSESEPLSKTPLQSQKNSSKTENNKKPEGRNESSTVFYKSFDGSFSNGTEMNKQKSLKNETNHNAEKDDVSKPRPKIVQSGDIKSRYGSFDGSGLDISENVHRTLDQSLLEPATKVMNSTDMLGKSSKSFKEVSTEPEFGFTNKSQTEPSNNSLLTSTHNETKHLNNQVDVMSSFELNGSGLSKSLKVSPAQQLTTLNQNGTVHNGKPMLFLKPEDTSELNKDLLQDISAHNPVSGNARNLRNLTHITNSLNATTEKHNVSTDFETNILNSVNESDSKHVFRGMNHLPYGSMKFPRNSYPIQVIHPSTIFKQPLIQKLYTLYRGQLYLLVPVPRYDHTILKNDNALHTNNNDRLPQEGLPGQEDQPTEQQKPVNWNYPFYDKPVLESNKLDTPNEMAYDGVYSQWQQSQHKIYQKPSSYYSYKNLNIGYDRYDDNQQRNIDAITQQRQNLSYTKPPPSLVNLNEVNIGHTSYAFQIGDKDNFSDRNTDKPSIEQAYFSQKPSGHQQTVHNPTYIQPSLINPIQRQTSYSNSHHPYVSSTDGLTVESNTHHQPYYSIDSPIKQQTFNPQYINSLSSLYGKGSLGTGRYVGISDTAIHPQQEFYSYPQETRVHITANNPISTQFPSNPLTTFEGQPRNNEILSHPFISENRQLYRSEPIEVSIRGQVPTGYNRKPRLVKNKVTAPETFAQTYYETERKNYLNPDSDQSYVILRETRHLPSHLNLPINSSTNDPDIQVQYNQNSGEEPSQDPKVKHIIDTFEDQQAVKKIASSQPGIIDNGNLLSTITSELNQIVDQLSTIENHPEVLYRKDLSKSQPFTSHTPDVQTYLTPGQHVNYLFPRNNQPTINHLTVGNKRPATFNQISEHLILQEESQSNGNSNIKNSRQQKKLHQPLFEKDGLRKGPETYEKSNSESSGQQIELHQPFENILKEGPQIYENSNVENSRKPIKIYEPFDYSILNEGSQTSENSNFENSIRPINLPQLFEKSTLNEGSQKYENSKIANSRLQLKHHQPLFEKYILKKVSQPYNNLNLENSGEPIEINQPFGNFILNEGSQGYEISNIENSRRPTDHHQPFEKSILDEGFQPFEKSNVENSGELIKSNQPFENLIFNEGSETYDKTNNENSRTPIISHDSEKSILNERYQPYENSNIKNSKQPIKINQLLEGLILNEGAQTYEKSNIKNNRRPINHYQPVEDSLGNDGSKSYGNSLSNQNARLHSGPSYSSWNDHEPLAHRQEFSTSSYLDQLNNGHYHQTPTGRHYLPILTQYNSKPGSQYSAADPTEPTYSPLIDINNHFPSITYENNQYQTPLYTVPEENLPSYQVPKFVSPYDNTEPYPQFSFDRSQRLQRTYGYGQTNKMPSFPGASFIKRKNDINSGGTTKTVLDNSKTNPLNVRSIDWTKYKRSGKKTPNVNRTLDRTFSPVSSQVVKTTQTKANDDDDNPNVLINDPNVSKPQSPLYHNEEPFRPEQSSGKLTNTDKGIVTDSALWNEKLMLAGKNEVPTRYGVNNNNLYHPQPEERFTGHRNSFNSVPATDVGSMIPSNRNVKDGRNHENQNRFHSMESSKSQQPLYNSDSSPESSRKYINGQEFRPPLVYNHHRISEGRHVERQYGQPFSYPMISKLGTPTQINHKYYNKPQGGDLQNFNFGQSELNSPQTFQGNYNNHFRKINPPIYRNKNDDNRQPMSRDDIFNNVLDPSSSQFHFPQHMQPDSSHYTFANQPNPKKTFHMENPRNARKHYHNSFSSKSQTFHLPQPTWQDENKLFSSVNAPAQRPVNQFHKQPVSEENNLNGLDTHPFVRLPQIVREDGFKYSPQMNTHSPGNTVFQESQKNNVINPSGINQPASQYSVKPNYFLNSERSPIEANNFINGFQINNQQGLIGGDDTGNRGKYISYSGSNIQNQPALVQHGISQISQRYHENNHLGSSQFEHQNGYYTNTVNHNNPVNVQQDPLSYYHGIYHRKGMSHASPGTRHLSSNPTLYFDQANKDAFHRRTHQLNSLDSNVNSFHSARGESYNLHANYNNRLNTNVNTPITPSLHHLQPLTSDIGNTSEKSISNTFPSQVSNADGRPGEYTYQPKPVNVNSHFPEIQPSSGDKGNNNNNNINNGFQLNPSQNYASPDLNSPFPEVQPSSGDKGDSSNNNINNLFPLNPRQNNVNPALNSPFPGIQSVSGGKLNNMGGNINTGFQLNPSQNYASPVLNSPFHEVQSSSGDKGDSNYNSIINLFPFNPHQNNVNPAINSPFPGIQSFSVGKLNNMDNNVNTGFQLNPSQTNVNPASNSPLPEIQSSSGDKRNKDGKINNGFQLNPSQNSVKPALNSFFPEIKPHSGDKVNNNNYNINNGDQLNPSQDNVNPALSSPFPEIQSTSGGEGNNMNINFRNEFKPYNDPFNVSSTLNSPNPEIQSTSGGTRNDFIDTINNGFQFNPSQNNFNRTLNPPVPEIQPNSGVDNNMNIDTNNGFWNINKSLENYGGIDKSNGVADDVDEMSEDLSKIFQKRIARLNKLSEKLSAPIAINDFSQNRITSRNGALLGLQNKTKNGNAENDPKHDKDKKISNENLNSSQPLETKINSSSDSSSVNQEGCLINGTLMEVGEEWTVVGVCGVYTCQSNGVRVLDSTCPKLKLIEDQQCEIEKADNDLEFPLCCPTLKCKPKNDSPKNGTSQHGS